MLKATFSKHTLVFKQAGGTSRGVLHQKPSWFIKVFDEVNPKIIGIGECSIIPNLSPDDFEKLEPLINKVSENINSYLCKDKGLKKFPSIQFGLETALIDLKNNGQQVLFPSEFTEGKDTIKINGLIWMGSKKFMQEQIKEKIKEGFKCIKLKIGALNFEDELKILKGIREEYHAENIELRLDANGAFSPTDALEKLERLSDFNIHSIEQPIKAGQFEAMAELCQKSPIPIALDEELIGVSEFENKQSLLKQIQPQFIILKPSLLGGFEKSEEWINLADENNISWWVTSALESNIGLNAIAQWTYQLQSELPQGLGTGKLFTNNIPSPLRIQEAKLFYRPEIKWDLKSIS